MIVAIAGRTCFSECGEKIFIVIYIIVLIGKSFHKHKNIHKYAEIWTQDIRSEILGKVSNVVLKDGDDQLDRSRDK